MKAVNVTVRFTILVPENTDTDSITLQIPTRQIVPHASVGGKPREIKEAVDRGVRDGRVRGREQLTPGQAATHSSLTRRRPPLALLTSADGQSGNRCCSCTSRWSDSPRIDENHIHAHGLELLFQLDPKNWRMRRVLRRITHLGVLVAAVEQADRRMPSLVTCSIGEYSLIHFSTFSRLVDQASGNSAIQRRGPRSCSSASTSRSSLGSSEV